MPQVLVVFWISIVSNDSYPSPLRRGTALGVNRIFTLPPSVRPWAPEPLDVSFVPGVAEEVALRELEAR